MNYTAQQLTLIALCLSCAVAQADDEKWKIHSNIDLFAFSEVVSVDQFATDFKDDLVSGNTAFTQDKFEIGARYKSFRISYVARFDYITEFTEDTALFHHSEKNLIPIPTNRGYHLLLEVERASAQGIKLGYTWDISDRLSLDFAGTYYTSTSDLQSGFAEANGDIEPIDDALIADFNAVTERLTVDNRDLSPLLALTSDIRLNVNINYAYDQPKFGEKFYRKPIILGEPNPIISGIDFSEPEGTGYGFDFSIAWQATDKLNISADFIDLGYKITWKNAPQSIARLVLNDAIVDAIGVAQEFVNGEIILPNEIVDRQLLVDIFNADYEQTIPWRANVNASWQLDRHANLFGWQPNILLLGGFYHTSVKDFPRIGIGLNDTLQILYDFGGKAIHLNYQGKYGFAKLIADKFDTKKAHTLGIAIGTNIRF